MAEYHKESAARWQAASEHVLEATVPSPSRGEDSGSPGIIGAGGTDNGNDSASPGVETVDMSAFVGGGGSPAIPSAPEGPVVGNLI